jgi:hypothetical protein
MEIIGSREALSALPKDLADFVLSSCPWIDSEWDPTRIGWLFVLLGDGDDDVREARALCVVPHVTGDDEQSYRAAMTFDLETFDLWEPAVRDDASGVVLATAVVGEEFGFAVLLSPGLFDSLPGLRTALEPLLTGSLV